MIDTKEFYDYLIAKQLDFFAGVPDSLLKNLCACIQENSGKNKHIITANEGNAVAVASGYHLATAKYAIVYMQNSGIGNAVNPLVSLADEDVYSIPMLLVIGWRGEPGTKDEPQHKKQGKVTLSLFETIGIETIILDENYQLQIDYCYNYMKQNHKPIALIVQKGRFSAYQCQNESSDFTLTRECALENIIEHLNDEDFIVSTTGKTSREIFEIRERNHQGHSNDFLTVGSMGHTASIAFGMSLQTDRHIYCIDGDGSFLMHMGGLSVFAQNANHNFKYILINNGAHESVGGQPTVAFQIKVGEILKAVGFKNVYTVVSVDGIEDGIRRLKADKSLSALIVYTKQGSRGNLGRPTVSALDNKKAFMKKMGII